MAKRILGHLCVAAISLAALVACGGGDDAPASSGGTTGTGTTSTQVGITKIVISDTQPMWGGTSFGSAGAYEKLTGTAYAVENRSPRCDCSAVTASTEMPLIPDHVIALDAIAS